MVTISHCYNCSGNAGYAAAAAVESAICIECGDRISPDTTLIDSRPAPHDAGEPASVRAATLRILVHSPITATVVSTGVHALAALVLSLLYLSIDRPSHPRLVSGFSVRETQQDLLSAELVMPLPEVSADAKPAADTVAARLATAPLPMTEATLPADLFGGEAAADPSRGDHAADGSEGNGQRGGNRGGLFGYSGEVSSLAFVVDASGSMEGPRMRRVLEELAKSIETLQADQRFFVVFFNERTFPMMWPRVELQLLEASRENKQRVIAWARRVVPSETTMPQKALRTALELRPDLVLFLTDGEIPESTARIVRLHRHHHTRVDSIGIGTVADNPLMRKIADIGHGAFRVAP